MSIKDNVWESVTRIANKIQDKALSASSLEELLLILRNSDLPIPAEEFSLVYQEYGIDKPIFLVGAGKLRRENGFHEPFSAHLPVILGLIHDSTSEPLYLANQKDCKSQGFDDYKSILLAPLRLSDTRNIGVFIAHNIKAEKAYEGLAKPLDMLSDRLAFYLRTNFTIRRFNSFREFQSKLLRGCFHRESDIIKALVKKLKEWFVVDKIHIFLTNPLNTNEYFFACKDSEVIDNYIDIEVRLSFKLEHWLLEVLNNIKNTPKILNKCALIKSANIKSNCKSWLGTRMAVAAGSSIGFIIIENPISEDSYEMGEDRLIDDLSDFISLLLIEFRKKLYADSLFSIKSILLNRSISFESEVYQLAQEKISIINGHVPLAIFRIEHTTKDLRLVQSTINGFCLDSVFSENLLDYIKMAERHIDSYSSEDLVDKMTIQHGFFEKLLVIPMKYNNDDLGCFLILAPKCSLSALHYIEDIVDIVTVIVDTIEKENIRFSVLVSFGQILSKIKDATKEDILSTTYNYVSKAMYSENLYIALYDKDKNEVSFPLMIVNGRPYNQPSRLLKSNKRGKTEEIILTGMPILHRTKAESKAWYNIPHHREFLGDPLASWVGVPILASEGVRGVIAVYHPTHEYFYSQESLFFLQVIANQLSVLINTIEVKDIKFGLEDLQNQLKGKVDISIEKFSKKIVNNISLELESDDRRYFKNHFEINNFINILDGSSYELTEKTVLIFNFIKELRHENDFSQLKSKLKRVVVIYSEIDGISKAITLSLNLRSRGIDSWLDKYENISNKDSEYTYWLKNQLSVSDFVLLIYSKSLGKLYNDKIDYLKINDLKDLYKNKLILLVYEDTKPCDISSFFSNYPVFHEKNDIPSSELSGFLLGLPLKVGNNFPKNEEKNIVDTTIINLSRHSLEGLTRNALMLHDKIEIVRKEYLLESRSEERFRLKAILDDLEKDRFDILDKIAKTKALNYE